MHLENHSNAFKKLRRFDPCNNTLELVKHDGVFMNYKQVNCYECGELFVLNRPDRQFCSGRCRSQNFRRTQKEKLTTLEKLFEQYVPKQEAAPRRATILRCFKGQKARTNYGTIGSRDCQDKGSA